MTISGHVDPWLGLEQGQNLVDKLRTMHSLIRPHLPFVARVAIALYDPATDYLRTFAWSSDEHSPLTQYQARLADCHSLVEIVGQRQPRVVNDLGVYNNSDHLHARIIYEAGYRSSYTVPMFWEGKFFGLVFFNARETDVFDDRALSELDVIAHMLTLLVNNERSNIHTLQATIKSALELTHTRDPETGSHLERMSRYARLIALEIARRRGYDDNFVERIFLFAPLHDLGKLAIPDRILLKQGPLDDQEYAVMRTHSREGRKLIDKLLVNYGLHGVSHVEMLRNIALHHHEAVDGSGYPDKLKGEGIPIEARIVAVADVFDALTSQRPYKRAWSNSEAFARLREDAGVKLDAECVEILLACEQQIVEIQRTFVEDSFGS